MNSPTLKQAPFLKTPSFQSVLTHRVPYFSNIKKLGQALQCKLSMDIQSRTNTQTPSIWTGQGTPSGQILPWPLARFFAIFVAFFATTQHTTEIQNSQEIQAELRESYQFPRHISLLTLCWFWPYFVSCGTSLAVKLVAGQRNVGAGFCPQKSV